MNSRKLAMTALAIAIMFTVAMPVLADRGNHRQDLWEPPTTARLHSYITGYCFNPSQDYNCDGSIDQGDCFVEFYHSTNYLLFIRLGIVHNWQGAEATYRELQIEQSHPGYNRYYSSEFSNLNLLVDSITIRGYGYYDGDTIDNLDYESIEQAYYTIIEYR